jgi:hypothetical protein
VPVKGANNLSNIQGSEESKMMQNESLSVKNLLNVLGIGAVGAIGLVLLVLFLLHIFI